MKKVAEYKKLYNITGDIELKSIKSTYRTFMKDCHPDKFPNGGAELEEAEAKSKIYIEAYHFLVSIAPETHIANSEEYVKTTTTSGIDDFKYKGLMLEVIFLDGSKYEYFGVPKSVYIKFVNSPTQYRFAKRHIFDSYLRRNVSKRKED